MPSYLRKALDVVAVCLYIFLIVVGFLATRFGDSNAWFIVAVGILGFALRAGLIAINGWLRGRGIASQAAQLAASDSVPPGVVSEARVRSIRILLIGYTTPLVAIAAIAASVAHALPEEFQLLAYLLAVGLLAIAALAAFQLRALMRRVRAGG